MNYEQIKQKYAGAVSEKCRQLDAVDRRIETTNIQIKLKREEQDQYRGVITAEAQRAWHKGLEEEQQLKKRLDELNAERTAIAIPAEDLNEVAKSLNL